MAWVPDSLPDVPEVESQRYAEYGLEATQLSQPVYSQASQFVNSQVEPRRQYWAILIPINRDHAILKIPWTRTRLQIGRGGHADVGNHVILNEKRISNRHCRIMLGLHGRGVTSSDPEEQARLVQQLKDGEAEPEVWIEDLNSSNGTFVNGIRIKPRRMLVHGDEVSLGHKSNIEGHDARYIFRSVGCKGARREDGERAPGEVYERYQILDTLGKGTFAEVKKAVDINTGDLRAIKQIVKHRFDHNEKTLNLFQREIDICTTLHHENICRLIDWYTDPQHICLVLEYIDGGDMLDYIMKYPGEGIPEADAAEFTFQICRAMAYCHENGVTHRDLKPENILLTKETESQGRIIKIADFGLAKMVHAQTMLTSMVGTPQYLAPEVVMQTKTRPGYENVVDSWSVGIIVYSMLTKALPFDDSADLTIEQRIRQRYEMDYDREPLHAMGVSDAGIDFIDRLIERDPSKRMTMQQALEHEWLAGPSSQPQESLSQVLGGDSMWNIQSFDSMNDVEDENEQRGGWSRPMTESTTNFKMSSTGESFSQPMEGLRLESKASADYPLSPSREEAQSEMDWDEDRGRKVSGTAGPSPDTSFENDDEVKVNGHADAGSPKKAEQNGVVSKMDVDCPPRAARSSMEVDPPAVTTAPNSNRDGNSTSNKRKQTLSMFSSGSLSPPPDEQSERETTPQPGNPPAGGHRVMTRNATAKAATPSKKRDSTSPKTSAAGPRKSRRLG